MCLFGQQQQDNSAAIARQQAAEREAKVTAGKEKIDSAFGVFDPEYYDKYQQTYLENYNPQVDKQYGDARQKLKYNLTRSGTVDSTPGQKSFGDLVTGYQDARREIASGAVDATSKLKNDVESAKTDLYAQNTASADPALSGIQAVSRAGALQSEPSYTPLGDLFTGIVNTSVPYFQGRNASLPAGYRSSFYPGATTSRSNSGRVVS